MVELVHISNLEVVWQPHEMHKFSSVQKPRQGGIIKRGRDLGSFLCRLRHEKNQKWRNCACVARSERSVRGLRDNARPAVAVAQKWLGMPEREIRFTQRNAQRGTRMHVGRTRKEVSRDVLLKGSVGDSTDVGRAGGERRQ